MTALALPAPSASALSTLAADSAGHEVIVTLPLDQRDRPLVGATADSGSAPTPFAPLGAPWVESPDAAVLSDGTAFVAWKRMDPQGSEVGTPYAAVRDPGAGSFGPAIRLANGTPAETVTLAVNTTGDAVVGWSPDKGQAQMAIRPAHGTFGPPLTIPGSTPFLLDLALDDDGGVLAVWENRVFQPPKNPIVSVAAAYRPPGGAFGAPQAVSGAPSLYNVRFAANHQGDALLAWVNGTNLQVAERQPGGLFGTPATIDPDVAKGTVPSRVAIADSGAAIVGFFANGALRAIDRAPGGAFGAPEVVSPTAASEVTMAIDDAGDAAAVWQDDVAGPAVFGSYRPSTGTWRPAMQLSNAEPYAPGRRYPTVAIGPGGQARAVWEDDSGNEVDLLSRTFGPSPLSPPATLRRVPSFVRDAPASACTPTWARVYRRTSTADVIQSKNGYDKGELYGCLFARGSQFDLSGPYDVWFPPSVAVAGPFAAIAGFGCDPDGNCGSTSVDVTDLRDEESRFARGADAGVRNAAEVSALRLRPDGGVAWVSCPTEFSSDGVDHECKVPSHKTKWVYEWGPHQVSPRLVATSRDVDPRTLRLQGRRVRWLQRGHPHSVLMP